MWNSNETENFSSFEEKTADDIGLKIPPGDAKKEEYRLKTFRKFPPNAGVDPDKLAQCGFIYTGTKDKVICFSCMKVIQNWSALASGSVIDPADARWHNEDCAILQKSGPGHSISLEAGTGLIPIKSRPLAFSGDDTENSNVSISLSIGNFSYIPSSQCLPKNPTKDRASDSGIFSKPSDAASPQEGLKEPIRQDLSSVPSILESNRESQDQKKLVIVSPKKTPTKGFKLSQPLLANQSGSFPSNRPSTSRNIADRDDDVKAQTEKLLKQTLTLNKPEISLKVDYSSPEKAFISPHTSDSSEEEDVFPPLSSSNSQKWDWKKNCNLWKEGDRRKTYSSTDWDGNLVNRLAESGFYYLNSLGGQLNTCCRSCGVEITSWSQDDNVDDRHRQVSPQCRLILGMEKRNISLKINVQPSTSYSKIKDGNIATGCIRSFEPQLPTCDVSDSSTDEDSSRPTQSSRQAKQNQQMPSSNEIEVYRREVRRTDDQPSRCSHRVDINKRMCRACPSKEADVLIMPCRHLAICSACLKFATRCPQCSEEILNSIVIRL